MTRRFGIIGIEDFAAIQAFAVFLMLVFGHEDGVRVFAAFVSHSKNQLYCSIPARGLPTPSASMSHSQPAVDKAQKNTKDALCFRA